MNTVGTPQRTDDVIASYSSKGPTAIDHIVKPDIVAPGNRFVSLMFNPKSTLAGTYPGNVVPYSYYEARRETAAFVYLFLAERHEHGHPDGQRGGSPDVAKRRATHARASQGAADGAQGISGLQYRHRSGARPDSPRPIRHFHSGRRIPDIWAALHNTELGAVPALSPAAVFQNGSVSVVYDASAVWGSSAVLGQFGGVGHECLLNGTSAVWGSSAFGAAARSLPRPVQPASLSTANNSP